MQWVNTEKDIDDRLRSPLDTKQLERFIADYNTGKHQETAFFRVINMPVSVQQFNHGQSNPTYLITDAKGIQYVLRRKPSANKLLVNKTAHAIEREYYMLKTIHEINLTLDADKRVPVVEVLALVEDESYIGQVFYLMKFSKGRIFHDTFAPSDEQWQDIVRVLRNIHQFPAKKLFEQLPTKYFKTSSKGNYFERQVGTLSKVSAMQCKGAPPIPDFEYLSKYLLENSPKGSEIQLIHGDFKVDNMVFHPTEPKVIAVLDWELCTYGHPLFDVANLLQPFILPDKINTLFGPVSTQVPAEKREQVLSKLLKSYGDPLVSRYWNYGVVFGLYRLAVISQGIRYRLSRGVASSASAEKTGQMYPLLAETAMKYAVPSSKI